MVVVVVSLVVVGLVVVELVVVVLWRCSFSCFVVVFLSL